MRPVLVVVVAGVCAFVVVVVASGCVVRSGCTRAQQTERSRKPVLEAFGVGLFIDGISGASLFSEAQPRSTSTIWLCIATGNVVASAFCVGLLSCPGLVWRGFRDGWKMLAAISYTLSPRPCVAGLSW